MRTWKLVGVPRDPRGREVNLEGWHPTTTAWTRSKAVSNIRFQIQQRYHVWCSIEERDVICIA